MLRAFLIAAALSCAVPSGIGPALAQEPGQDAPDRPRKPLSAMSVEEVLDRLAASPTPQIGAQIEAEALRRFHESGSATIDLLLAWATTAMQDERYPVALDVLDQIVLLAPGFAEGWNKRATVYFLVKDYGKSIADIRHTLALQPRHFGALAGLGLILRDIGQPQKALEAFQAALAVNPHLENAKKVVKELEEELAGDTI